MKFSKFQNWGKTAINKPNFSITKYIKIKISKMQNFEKTGFWKPFLDQKIKNYKMVQK